MELARRENTVRELSNSSLCKKGMYKETDKDLAIMKSETVEALSTVTGEIGFS
jgi:hypothetical protein